MIDRIIQAERTIDTAILRAGKAAQQQYRAITQTLEAAHASGDQVQIEQASRQFADEMKKGGILGRVLQAHHTWSQLVTERDDCSLTRRLFPEYKPVRRSIDPTHEAIYQAWIVFYTAKGTATDDEIKRYNTAIQMLAGAPKYSEKWRKVVRRIDTTIASQSAVGRLLAAHKALSVYGQIYPIIPLSIDTPKRN